MLRRISLVLLVLLVIGASGYAGVWLGQHRLRVGSGAPFTATGTVSGKETIIRAAVPGRIRLLAVAPGDVVKAGQLVAWLEAPELRTAVEEAEEAVRDAQRDLERLRNGRPASVQEAYDRAKAAADAAQRALEDAQALSDEAPVLAQRLAAAQARRDEAAAALAAAEARLREARAAGAGASADGGALESQPGDAASGHEGDSGGSESGAPGQADVSAAAAAVERARQRLEAAEQDLAEARHREGRARQATERLSWLAQRANEAASALEAARAALESASLQSGRQTEEDRLRAAVREAQAVAARARARLKEAVVTAPVAGLISRVAAASGGELAAGDEIAAVQCLDPVWVEVILDATLARRVARNQPVVATAPAHAGLRFQGSVQEMAPHGREPSSPWTIQAALQNPAFRLRPGDTVQVTFQ